MMFSLAWLGLLAWTGWRADLAESNLQANLIRITRYLNSEGGGTVLVGSSVAGRLLPEYFQGSGLEVANLGLDGSRPLFVFEVLGQREQPPDCILVDTSTLFQPLEANDALLRESMASPTIAMSKWNPLFRPENRPVSTVYEKLKAFRERLTEGRAQEPCRAGGLTQDLPPTYNDVRTAIASLKDGGTRVILLDIPRGEGWAMPLSGPARTLADELRLPVLQPGPAIHASEGNVLRFSDGLHLDGPSARKVAGWVGRAMASREALDP
jgi:hypothetical protein